MKWLRKVLKKISGQKATRGELLHLYIQCEKCGEKLKIGISKETDLERTYEEEKGGPAYRLRKEAMDSKCFSIMTVTAEFDMNKSIITRDISNGRFITEQE